MPRAAAGAPLGAKSAAAAELVGGSTARELAPAARVLDAFPAQQLALDLLTGGSRTDRPNRLKELDPGESRRVSRECI